MSERINTVQALNWALDDALAADRRVVLFGEEVADPEGGGIMKVTAGLSTKYGDRVRSTPISEMAFTGAAVTMSMYLGRRNDCETANQVIREPMRFSSLAIIRSITSPFERRWPMRSRLALSASPVPVAPAKSTILPSITRVPPYLWSRSSRWPRWPVFYHAWLGVSS